MFGINVGITGFLNNDFITSVQVLDPKTIIILLGIGLGIGSLKEYIHNQSEPSQIPKSGI